MTKQQAHKHNQVEVSFSLPQIIEAKSISIVGDFNSWNQERLPMKRNKKGAWQAKLKLEPNHSYEFRYLLDGDRWLNDDACESCPNPFGTNNSVLVLSQEA